MNTLIDQMLSRYETKTTEEKHNALHEVMQQIALAGLYRAGFFEKAAFYGGTCLRIFHDLTRFSEDMDFSLLASDPTFSLEDYFEPIKNEFIAAGREVVITRKEKKGKSNIESAFLKEDSESFEISYGTGRPVKIKIEVDKDPPLGFQTEYKLILLPFSFMTRCFTVPGLFAGKMHAFLFRNWKTRVKGRDWYDLEWYVRNQHPLDFGHLFSRCQQSGHISNGSLSKDEFIVMVKKRIAATNIEQVVKDVEPFIKNRQALEIWSTDYFLQLADRIILQ
ncbi:MAG: nucleotidyl transferase AbiEii/AbiGii toxin family protein [Bacteroidetes bacterium]|nr:nucleotidyl transferase AbiEii/AbiGii toxin family protein [Bacteroidota bacterium]